MKRSLLLLAGALLFATTGAFAQRSSSKTITTTRLAEVQETFERTEALSLETGHEMLVAPLIATVHVIPKSKTGTTETFESKKFEGEYLMSKLPNIKGLDLNRELEIYYTQLKGEAIYDFCQQEKADLIVLPQFKITHEFDTSRSSDENGNSILVEIPRERNGKYVMKVEITGFPARYSGFRVGTAADGWIKDLYLRGKLKNEEVHVQVEEETRKIR